MTHLPKDAGLPSEISNQMKKGFPIFFAEVSEDLGRYEEVKCKASMIAVNFPRDQYPRLLDVCCGLGTYSEALANEGYGVTAIDISSEQIETCKSRDTNVDYQIGDMRITPKGGYDLIINMYSSFGYMDSVEEDISVLSAWFESLREGGVLIMELTDLERAKNSFGYPHNKIDRSTNGVAEYLNIDWHTQVMTIDYVRDGKKLSIMTRVYSADQLRVMLGKAGFKDVEFFGSLDMKTAKTPEKRLVIRCMK